MICPACRAENDEAAEVCFTCRAVLTAVTQGSVLGGRYEVVRLLGRGGMGTVYEAHDRILDEKVAVKVLRADVAAAPGMARRFRSEIKLSRRVSHWNVCRIHEYGEDGALQYISMELVEGQNLKERLREGPLAVDAAYRLAIEAAEGLQAIHRAGIVHRDLKPANIMIVPDGSVRLMDFGIAKPAAAEPTVAGVSGYVLGTPEYMSPEQARGLPVDFRSDLYSLGIVIYEAFTGRVPFRGDSPVSTLMMQAEAPPPLQGPAAERIPPALVPVLRRLLAKRPQDRPGSAGELAESLRQAHAPWSLAESGSDRAFTARLLPKPRRAAWLVPLLVAGLAGAYLGLRRVDGARQRVDHTTASPTASPPAATPGEPITPPAVAPKSPPSAVASASASPTVTARPTPTSRPTAPARPLPSDARSVEPRPSDPVPSPGEAVLAEPTPPAPSRSAEAAPSPAPTPVTSWLLVLVTPWAEVSVDGVVVGETPMPRIPVIPGTHLVLIVHPSYEPYPWKPTVAPGQTARIVVDLRNEGVPRKR
jgi:serine/threonine protein kinase